MQIIHPAEITENRRAFSCTQLRGQDGESLLTPVTMTVQSDDGIVRITMGTSQVVLVGEQCRELAFMFCEAAGMDAFSRK